VISFYGSSMWEMKMRDLSLRFWRIFLGTCGLAALLTSPARAEIGSRYTLCKLNKEVRTLRIEKVSGGRCKTAYSKLGKDQIVGEAQNPNSCGEVLERVKTNLESAGWKCREVKDSTVSNLNADVH